MKVICIFLLFAALPAFSQQSAQWNVEGKIINSSSKEPVAARIIYESLPYGGNIGFLNGDSFSFNIPKSTEYRLKVEAEGFMPYFHEITLNEFREGKCILLVELVPNGINQLIRLEKLIFAIGDDKISEESHEELNTIAEMMLKNPKMIVQLEGHTDYRGNASKNMRLSEKRVEAVKNYLLTRGVEKRRIRTKAFGGTQPVTRNSDPESRDRNRRVEVRILANN